MIINLIPDSSVSSAPAGFTAEIQAAADVFDQDIPGDYTVNITYGWGTYDGVVDDELTNPNSGAFSYGGTENGTAVDYATLKKWLSENATLSDQMAAVASLPASYTALPDDTDEFWVTSAQEKALGVYVGSAGAVDGSIGFNTGDANSPPADWEIAALTEIVHALGDLSSIATPNIMDLYRFSAPGDYQWTSGQPAYFSINDGATDLANFATSFDTTLFQNAGASANDPFAYPFSSATSSTLTSLDLEVLNVMGFGGTAITIRDDFNNDGRSDILIENTSGAVVVGEVHFGALSYSVVTGLGPEWTFGGNGDFLGRGEDDFVIRDTAGAVYIGAVADGATSYTLVGGLGPEWRFRETGDFLGDGHDQFLIENTSGAVYLGNVVGGQTQYTPLGGLGPEWSFGGAGDLLGDGKTAFLIRDTSEAVYVGEVSNGAVAYTEIAILGLEWSFKAVGDFLGDGHDQFLMESTSGAVEIGDFKNGVEQYTLLGGLGPEWSFLGAGDYLSPGTSDFMIKNTAGAVYLGAVSGGAVSYSLVGGLGPEWTSHS